MFVFNGTAISSDSPLTLRTNLIKKYDKQLWQLMKKLKIKNFNMILIKKQQKYSHYHQIKFKNMNISQGKKKLPSNQSGTIKQAKFTYSLLGKPFRKQARGIEERGGKQRKTKEQEER